MPYDPTSSASHFLLVTKRDPAQEKNVLWPEGIVRCDQEGNSRSELWVVAQQTTDRVTESQIGVVRRSSSNKSDVKCDIENGRSLISVS